MDFCGEATMPVRCILWSRSHLCSCLKLALLDPPFYPSARVRSDHCGIDHDTFHVSIVSEVFKHGIPNSAFSPTIESFVNSVPVTIFFGKESPLSTTPGHPEDGVDESFAKSGLTDVEVGSRLEVDKNFLPLLSVEFDVSHNLF
jgi:hypothetical protein